MREALGLSPDGPLDIDVVDGHLEISARHEPPLVLGGPHRPTVAATGTSVSNEDVRRVLETVRTA
jgi:hypothetical protein